MSIVSWNRIWTHFNQFKILGIHEDMIKTTTKISRAVGKFVWHNRNPSEGMRFVRLWYSFVDMSFLWVSLQLIMPLSHWLLFSSKSLPNHAKSQVKISNYLNHFRKAITRPCYAICLVIHDYKLRTDFGMIVTSLQEKSNWEKCFTRPRFYF